MALRRLTRRQFVAIAFGAGAFVLAACQGGTNPSSVGALPKINVNPEAGTYPAPRFSFVPYTLPYANDVEITGVDSNSNATRISGVYFNTPKPSATTLYNSFTARVFTGTSTPCNDFGWTCPTADPQNPPSGSNIFINEISAAQTANSNFSVGYAPPFTTSYGCAGTICGVISDPRGTTSSGPPRHTYQIQVGSCHETYLYGTSDPLIQVGYYIKGANCLHAQAFEEYLPPHGSTPVVVDFHLPSNWNSTDSMAYGINNKGDVVGEYRTGTSEIGWEYHEFCYYKIQYDTSSGVSLQTQARGINWADIVVGSYEDQRTTKQIPNGFVESGGTPYTVNDGTNEAGTVVNNINNDDVIVGYHVGGGNHGDYIGFTARCKGSDSDHVCPADPPTPSSSCESQLRTDRATDSATRRRP